MRKIMITTGLVALFLTGAGVLFAADVPGSGNAAGSAVTEGPPPSGPLGEGSSGSTAVSVKDIFDKMRASTTRAIEGDNLGPDLPEMPLTAHELHALIVRIKLWYKDEYGVDLSGEEAAAVAGMYIAALVVQEKEKAAK